MKEFYCENQNQFNRLENLLIKNSSDTIMDKTNSSNELNEISQSIRKKIYIDEFKLSGKLLALGGACGTLGYEFMKVSFDLGNYDTRTAITVFSFSFLSMFTGLQCGYYSISSFKQGIKEYLNLKKEK